MFSSVSTLEKTRPTQAGKVILHTLVSLGLGGVVLVTKSEEILALALLEETHQRALQSLAGSAGHLANFVSLGDVAAIDQHKVQVAGNFQMGQNADQLACSRPQMSQQEPPNS